MTENLLLSRQIETSSLELSPEIRRKIHAVVYERAECSHSLRNDPHDPLRWMTNRGGLIIFFIARLLSNVQSGHRTFAVRGKERVS